MSTLVAEEASFDAPAQRQKAGGIWQLRLPRPWSLGCGPFRRLSNRRHPSCANVSKQTLLLSPKRCATLFAQFLSNPCPPQSQQLRGGERRASPIGTPSRTRCGDVCCRMCPRLLPRRRLPAAASPPVLSDQECLGDGPGEGLHGQNSAQRGSAPGADRSRTARAPLERAGEATCGQGRGAQPEGQVRLRNPGND